MLIVYDGHFNEIDNYVDYKDIKIALHDGMTFIKYEESIILRT